MEFALELKGLKSTATFKVHRNYDDCKGILLILLLLSSCITFSDSLVSIPHSRLRRHWCVKCTSESAHTMLSMASADLIHFLQKMATTSRFARISSSLKTEHFKSVRNVANQLHICAAKTKLMFHSSLRVCSVQDIITYGNPQLLPFKNV